MTHSYNTQRSHLILKEYGRNVQNLIAFLNTIKSKEERSKYAYVLVGLMRQLNPTMREHQDSNQRVWDHMHLMSKFTLEIDAPYPTPEQDSFFAKPRRMGYTTGAPKFKHYGKNVEVMIEKAIAIQDERERLIATIFIFKMMKGFYTTWNRENVEEETILKDLHTLSKGRLPLTSKQLREEENFQRHQQQHYPRQQYQQQNQQRQRQQGGNNNYHQQYQRYKKNNNQQGGGGNQQGGNQQGGGNYRNNPHKRPFKK
jgi:hypothetical protein